MGMATITVVRPTAFHGYCPSHQDDALPSKSDSCQVPLCVYLPSLLVMALNASMDASA